MPAAATATDSFTKKGAERLARTISDHWRSRGHKGVTTRVEPVAGQENMFGVRSNLVNGRPLRKGGAS